MPATAFLGRERELGEVVSLLRRDDVRLVTLTGPGGTGKTRLAVQAAAEVADRFPDGVWWAALAPLRDPTLVLTTLMQALAVKEQPGQPLFETLATALAGKRSLLLLDNVEHLLPDAAADVARLRDLGGPTVLVTTRERLQVEGEHTWPVPSLGDEDGVTLFVVRAQALEPSFVATPSVAELCERLDNLPLALELAAARTVVFSPEQLLERLGQRLDLLRGGRDADPRQQTLRATIEWSYELLGADERQLFRGLSVFAGGCTYEAAEAVCAADPDTLQSLLDKSLIRRRDSEAGPATGCSRRSASTQPIGSLPRPSSSSLERVTPTTFSSSPCRTPVQASTSSRRKPFGGSRANRTISSVPYTVPLRGDLSYVIDALGALWCSSALNRSWTRGHSLGAFRARTA